MKVCSKCKIEKELSEFSKAKRYKYGVHCFCKKCVKKCNKEYHKKNKDKSKEYRENNKDRLKEWHKNNKDKIKEQRRLYYENNKENIKEKRKEYYKENKHKIKEYGEKYYKENKDKIKDYKINNKDIINKKVRIYINEKRLNNSIFRSSQNLRNRVKSSFKVSRWNKNNTTKKMLGCNYETAHKHLEKQFTDGMNWENYGEWHIDHIIPLASATTEKELIKLCHYTNLQPLWAADNLSKGAKIT